MFVIKGVIISVVFLALGAVFFLQKQHEKKQALELAKVKQEAFEKAHASPSVAASLSQHLPQPTTTSSLKSAPTAKPKPTSMLPKPTPMLHPNP
ncbi:MAG: hypothetical protein DMF04_11025 [Verrucomicrobia bacterium]|nr:MAG: hypothetical protein DMF04_11025 [Verrucomicrobiota bacterium]